jgi:hypothetical protein
MAMVDEENAEQSVGTKVTSFVQNALWKLLEPALAVGLLAVAMTEALLAPFFGTKLVLCSLATTGVAIGLTLANGALGVNCVGTWLAQIHAQVLAIRNEETKKPAESQQRAALEKPLSDSIN